MQNGCAMTYTVIYIFYCFLYSTYTLQICTKKIQQRTIGTFHKLYKLV